MYRSKRQAKPFVALGYRILGNRVQDEETNPHRSEGLERPVVSAHFLDGEIEVRNPVRQGHQRLDVRMRARRRHPCTIDEPYVVLQP
jgi:hypothetical protein